MSRGFPTPPVFHFRWRATPDSAPLPAPAPTASKRSRDIFLLLPRQPCSSTRLVQDLNVELSLHFPGVVFVMQSQQLVFELDIPDGSAKLGL